LSSNYNTRSTRSKRNKKSKVMDYSSFEFKKEEDVIQRMIKNQRFIGKMTK
jgi:hypothetical protein